MAVQATTRGRPRLRVGYRHRWGRTGRQGGHGAVRAADGEGEFECECEGVVKGSQCAAPTTNACAKAGMARRRDGVEHFSRLYLEGQFR